jgi:HEAT repeat protein
MGWLLPLSGYAEKGKSVKEHLMIMQDYDRSRAERAKAVKALEGSGSSEAIIPLIHELTRMEGDLGAEVRAALAKLGAAKFLASEIRAVEPERRLVAAELIGHVAAPEALEAVIGALKDAIPKVREHAAAALSRFGDAKAVPPLIALLASDPEADVRSAAAQALGKLGGNSAKEALEKAIRDEKDGFVRILVQEALEQLD